MGRLPGFDYKKPFFYMVTLKRAAGCGVAFSSIENGVIVPNCVTEAFEAAIRRFHETWYCIEPITRYAIMPDHIHLIMKLRSGAERTVSLGVLVRQLAKALEKSRPGAPAAKPEPVFAVEWHDWIVKRKGQLEAFTRYIAENPRRAWLRRQNRRFFTQMRKVSFAGREWFAYGNEKILELPVIEPFRCSRSWARDDAEWRKAVGRAERIGPGGAGAGTFMSPCEKECGNAIFKAGGAFIVLRPEGFGERWHPSREKERLCAEGRMLFLSLWPEEAARPDDATLYRRCHEMGDLLLASRQREEDE
ncbi:MAG: hypothetical protein IJ802_01200 [Kiritimatiellae bacterium]|nr:hypothetical protein [Kiritimatiellia bacterium]